MDARIRSTRRGVSLLEMLLALGLSVVVMGLIAMSINLNFRMYDTKRTSIEEARLARSVLRHIADDIRAAVQHLPPDLSGLETVIGNTQNANSALSGAGLGALGGATGQNGNSANGGNGQSGNQGSGGAQAGQQQGGSQNGTGGGGQTGTGGGNQNGSGGNGLPVTTSSTTAGVESQTGEAGSIYGEEQAGGIIGLYGSSTELQIDISRLPRVDQFQAATDADNLTGPTDIPSDMKTVTYFLRPEEGLSDVGLDGRGRGLMRRVLDRAVSNYEMQNGSNGTLGQLELMAEEVVGLQFMYFDGSSWTSDWDSASMEGLPVAIEITVILKSLADQEAANSASPSSSTDEDNERLYTLTVNLPTATTYEEKQLAAEEKRLAEEEKTALAQSGAIDTSGDAAAAGGGAGGFGGGMGGSGGGGRGQNGPGGDDDNGGGGRDRPRRGQDDQPTDDGGGPGDRPTDRPARNRSGARGGNGGGGDLGGGRMGMGGGRMGMGGGGRGR